MAAKPDPFEISRTAVEFFDDLNRQRLVFGEMGGTFVYPITEAMVAAKLEREGIQDEESKEEIQFWVSEMDEEHLAGIARRRANGK